MLKSLARKVRHFFDRPAAWRQERILLELGRMQAKSNALSQPASLHEVEFSIFSQNGEDGIIQYLLSRVGPRERFFVEFGVQDYRESNTRFLLTKDYWSGLILDADDAHLRYVQKESFLYQDRDLQAVQAFLTKENIVALFRKYGVPEELGLLSVDIDGNDYWILEALESYRPAILVAEYNAFFGPKKILSLPYLERFERWQAHPSGYYFGASLAALHFLLSPRGFALVACDARGSNAFFVRRDLLNGLRELQPAEAYVELIPGALMRFPEPLKPLRSLPLCDPRSGEIKSIGDWYQLP